MTSSPLKGPEKLNDSLEKVIANVAAELAKLDVATDGQDGDNNDTMAADRQDLDDIVDELFF
jgi:hypothetical protein